MYLKKGFSVKLVEEDRRQKTPDIQVTNFETNEHFYLEVSVLEQSDNRKLLDINYKTLWSALYPSGQWLACSCAQLQYISDDDMPGVLDNLELLKQKANEENSIVHFTDKHMRIAIAHPDKLDELNLWIEKNDYRKGLHGAPLSFDETNRVSFNKIPRKGTQVPQMSSGLIYIPVNALYFWGREINEVVSAFREQLSAFPNVFGIVAYGYLIDDLEAVSMEAEDYYYGIKKMNEAVIRHLLFVRNEQYSGNLSPSTIDRIYTSFR